MRKCRNCLCCTCIKSCKCQNCKGKIKECKRYSGFRQLSIFDILNDPQEKEQECKAAPRHPWSYYGITKERYRQLTEYIRSGEYASLAQSAALIANKDIAQYILLSVTKNKSYEGVEYAEGFGRIPCGRTDFYGYRRLFYHLLNKKLENNDNK